MGNVWDVELSFLPNSSHFDELRPLKPLFLHSGWRSLLGPTLMIFKAGVLSWVLAHFVIVRGFQSWSPPFRCYPISQHLSADPTGYPSPFEVLRNRNVESLKEGIAYSLKGDSDPLVNTVTVDHEKKRLVGMKVTTRKFSETPFSIPSVNEFFEMFGLNQPFGKQYKLVIMGIYDMSFPDPTGFGFAWKNYTESLQWWKDQTIKNSPLAWPNSLRIETYIARAPVYDIPPAILPATKRKRKTT